MKKIVIATALISTFAFAHAMDVSVSAVRDYTLHANGAKVTLGGYEVAGVKASLEATSVRTGNVGYTQYSLAAEKNLFNLGPVAFAGKASVGYLDRVGTNGSDGYVANLGVGASYSLAKNTSLVASFERRFGQERTNDLNGNMLTVGLRQSF